MSPIYLMIPLENYVGSLSLITLCETVLDLAPIWWGIGGSSAIWIELNKKVLDKENIQVLASTTGLGGLGMPSQPVTVPFRQGLGFDRVMKSLYHRWNLQTTVGCPWGKWLRQVRWNLDTWIKSAEPLWPKPSHSQNMVADMHMLRCPRGKWLRQVSVLVPSDKFTEQYTTPLENF